MDEIPQVELDKQDFMNESVLVPLMLYREGGLEAVYRGYNSRHMLQPEKYFKGRPAERFPLDALNRLVDSFNRHLEQRNFTEVSFGLHIAVGYTLGAREMPEDVKMLFGMV